MNWERDMPSEIMPCRITDGKQYDDTLTEERETPLQRIERMTVADAEEWLLDELLERAEPGKNSFLSEMLFYVLCGDPAGAGRVFSDCVTQTGQSALRSDING